MFLGLVTGGAEPRACLTCGESVLHFEVSYPLTGSPAPTVWLADSHRARCGLLCWGSHKTDPKLQLGSLVHVNACAACAVIAVRMEIPGA